MKLDKADIKAIAKGRVTKADSKNSNIVAILVALLVAAAILLSGRFQQSYWLAVVGLGLFYGYYSLFLNKKIKEATDRLLREWQAEQLHQ